MRRREFLLGVCAAFVSAGAARGQERTAKVQTVSGARSPVQLGFTLMHEHALVDFIGADSITPGRYRPDDVIAIVLPHLQRIVKLGCRTFVDCTPAYLGRDPRLLARLSRQSGLNILTTTGYYGAGSPAGRYVPAAAQQQTPEQLASVWIDECRRGIARTGIRPGIIKTGVSGRVPLTELDRKLIRAAAITQRETGLAIASHTGNGRAAIEQLEILKSEGVSGSAFIWVHAHVEADSDFHARAVQYGAWLEFDSLRPNSVERMLALVERMASQSRLGQVLVSGDAGWYHVGEPGGGAFAPYDLVFTEFLPEIKRRLGEDAARQLFVENPGRALTPARRS